MSPCYVSPLGPNLWLLGFEERQRWPLKMATAKFVWGQSHECRSLSVPPVRLRILPLLHSLFSLCPPANSHGHAHALAGAPSCTNDPANYVFKVFGSCENSVGLAWKVVGAVGERRVSRDVGWSMVSWLSLLPSVLCKHWIRTARADWGEGWWRRGWSLAQE